MDTQGPAGLKQGDAFLLEQTAVGVHLWIVLSCPERDPQGRALVVNVTSWASYADPACVLEPGEHPFIGHRSWVKYDGARLLPIEFIRRWRKGQPAVSSELLDRMIEGAEVSDRLPIDHREYLVAQGIIA